MKLVAWTNFRHDPNSQDLSITQEDICDAKWKGVLVKVLTSITRSLKKGESMSFNNMFSQSIKIILQYHLFFWLFLYEICNTIYNISYNKYI